MAKNEAKIKFTAETGEFNASIKQANEEMASLRAELNLNATQMKSTGATVEGLRKQHSLLGGQLKASESKTEALAQKFEKAVEIFGENSAEANRLKIQLTNAQIAEEKIRQAIDKVNLELEEQEKKAKESESATKQLTDSIGEQEAQLLQLKKAYVDAVLEYGKNSKEAKGLEAQISSLSSELIDNRDRMSEAEKEADKLDKTLANIDETAEEASSGFTVMKGALANLVSDGIQTASGALVDIGKEAFSASNDIDKATNAFVTQTGSSADAAEEFKDVMVAIYNNNFGENFEDIATAMATVKSNMGDLDDGELQKVTEGAILLRDTFEFEVGESTRAASMMIKQFGIDADTAYSLIATGAQNGLNINGDLMDIINEYSVHFSQLGLSADDMFKMLAGGAETGVFSVDKLGDALKEFGIRAKDGSDTTKAAFEYLGYDAESLFKVFNEGGEEAADMTRIIMQELSEMPDGVEKTTHGVALFGTMWEDLGDTAIGALSGFDSELDTTKNSLDEINKQKYNDLGSALEGVKRNLTTSVTGPIHDEALPAVNDFIEGVDWEGFGVVAGNAVGKLVDGLFAVVDGAISSVRWMKEHKGVVTAVATVIGILTAAITAYNVVQGIKTAMDAAQVTTIWGLVAAHWAQATAAMAAMAPYVLVVAAIAAVIAIIVVCIKYWDEIVAACKAAWDKICETLSVWGEWINTNVIQPVVSFFKSLWESIKSIWDTICNAVQVAIMFIGSIISAAWDIITLPFRFIWENCRDTVISVFNVVKNAISTALSAIGAWFSETWEKIKAVFAPVANWFSEKFNTAKEGILKAWSSVKQWFSDVWSGIKNVFSAVGSWFSEKFNTAKQGVQNAWSSVKGFFSNIWSGIKSAFSAVGSWFSNTFNKAKEAILKPINTAKDKIKGVVDSIKGFFSNLKLKLPSIKLPHFKIEGKLSLSPPSVPKLKIDWYAKAMNSPMVLNSPTIFGHANGRLLGGGEAGSEMIGGTNTVMQMIQSAVDRSIRAMNINALTAAVEDLANRPIELSVNGRQFALATAGDSDRVNGIRNRIIDRGVLLD